MVFLHSLLGFAPGTIIYAQTLIVVAFLIVKLFSVGVISRSHEHGFGRNLVEIDPRSLPDLFNKHLLLVGGPHTHGAI